MMPSYTFKCDKCEENQIVVMNISEYSDKQKCEKCGCLMLRNYQEEKIASFISDEPKTIGSLAEQNSKKFGIK